MMKLKSPTNQKRTMLHNDPSKMAVEAATDPRNEICHVRIIGTRFAAFLKLSSIAIVG